MALDRITMQKKMLIITVCMVFAAGAASAEPFAPKVDVPQEMLKPTHPAALDAMMAKDSKVPSKDAVEIPPFPAARILHTQQPSKGKINGQELQPNHVIVMGTEESLDDVVSFYHQNRPGWTAMEQWGTHTLYKGSGPFELMDVSSMTTPHVQVRKALPGESPLMPEMNTVIEIYYRP